MGARRARAVLPLRRVRRALIGPKLLWERKFGKFHTSRSRAARDINKRARRGQADRQSVSRSLRAAGKRREQKPVTPPPQTVKLRTCLRDFLPPLFIKIRPVPPPGL
ncbi:hypothetical protein AOLI_G00008220 [Acnodon oligacanthus]